MSNDADPVPEQIQGTRLRQTREPMDYVTAVEVQRVEAEHQKAAESMLAQRHRELASAEKTYREELAKAITRQRAGGASATAARDLARGEEAIAQFAYERDLKAGLVDAAQQSIWRHTANRRDLEHFIDWSKRAAFLDIERPAEKTYGGSGSGR